VVAVDYRGVRYVHGRYFTTLDEKNSAWQQTMLITVLLLPCMAGVIVCALNCVAW
jgi:hypothetical protein